MEVRPYLIYDVSAGSGGLEGRAKNIVTAAINCSTAVIRKLSLYVSVKSYKNPAIRGPVILPVIIMGAIKP